MKRSAQVVAGWIAMVIFTANLNVEARTFYVSPEGSNSAQGNETRPWRTLEKALVSVGAGDTVIVAGGVYSEGFAPSVSGTASAWIDFVAAPGETPVIDGSNVSLNRSGEGLVRFEGDVSYYRLRGFEIRAVDNRRSSASDPIGIALRDSSHHIEVIDCIIHDITSHLASRTPMGISIEGTVHDITIRGGSIFDIHTLAGAGGGAGAGNGHGIAVFGTERTPVDRVAIENLAIRNLVLGTSEALVFNGNVTNFRAINNTIHDTDNIAIDIIGFEGVGPDGLDQARDGHVAGNTIFNVSTRQNPAYNEFSAGGIYIDGGKDLLIERNKIYNCDIGIELASEDPEGVTSAVVVRDNVVWRNSIGGILLGGYDERRGATEDCMITNNTFYENDTRRFQIGEVNIRHETNRNVFTNNIFKAGAQGIFVTFPREFSRSKDNVFDGNCYFTTAEETGWEWMGRWLSSWSNWQLRSEQDRNGIFANPQFVANAGDGEWFGLGANSPAIDAGLSQPAAEGRVDVAGSPRLSGAGIDLGAFEWQATLEGPGGIASLALAAGAVVRNISVFPSATGFGDARIEFSSDGKSWTPIATRQDHQDSWSAISGVSITTSADATTLIDARPLDSGMYRGIPGNP